MEYHITSDGETDGLEWQGSGTLFISGDFDGAQVTLQVAPRENGDYVDVTMGLDPNGDPHIATFDDEVAVNFSLAKCRVRLSTDNAGNSTDIHAQIVSARDLS